VIFFDDFNGETTGLNKANFANWDVTDGSVDLVSGVGFCAPAASGNCVDLDGSTGNAGVFSTKTTFNLPAGDYELSFVLGGSHRGGTDDVQVRLG
jgi:hypothetical protein